MSSWSFLARGVALPWSTHTDLTFSNKHFGHRTSLPVVNIRICKKAFHWFHYVSSWPWSHFSEIFKNVLFSPWEIPCSQIPDSQEKINCWNFWISRRQCLSKETTLVDRWDKSKKTLCQQRLSILIRILGDKKIFGKFFLNWISVLCWFLSST